MTATRERIRTPRWVWPVVGALLFAQAVVLALWPAAHLLMIDLQVYRTGGEHLLTRTSLYDGGVLLDLPFVYPPFAALVFVPLTVLPLPILKLAWTLAGIALVVFVVRRCADLLGMRASPQATALLGAALLALDPIRTTFYLGQINVVLLALVLADVTGRPGRLRGIGVGLAAAVKLTPLVFVVYLVLIGRVRAAATAVATFVVAVGIGFLVAPADSATYWFGGTFAAADRISPAASTANHSLDGLLARAGAPGWVGIAATVALAAAGLCVAVLAHRRGEALLGVTLCGLLSAAVAPFAWSHHFVWFGPLVVLLGQRAATGDRRAAVALAGVLTVALAFVTRLPGPGVGPIPSTGLISLQPDVYLLAVVATIAVVWRSLVRRGQAT